MSLIGIAPPDRSTPVGKIRALVGDITFTDVTPTPEQIITFGDGTPEATDVYGTYQYFSDADLQLFVDVEGGSISGATAQAYEALAAILIFQASSITTNDLRVATEKRAELMLTLAGVKRRQAVAEGIEAMNDIFDVVPFTTRNLKGY